MAEYSGAISVSPSQAHTSDEEGEAVESPKSKTSPPQQPAAPTSSAELTRKPRGRPPGSKNKPKPPIVITRESDSSMRPAILEVSPGSDIIDSVVKFARRQHVGLSLISGAGTVSSVTLRHPINHAPSFSLHGPFSILSLSGTYISPPSTCSPNSSSSSATASASTTSSSSPCCFGISLAGQQGHVFGGIVAGEVIAASQVVVMAATFSNPSFHKLPSEVEDNSGVGTVAAGGEGGAFCVSAPTPLNCQLPPEILPWVPTPRPPPRY
ncbi:PPC domain [Dillenia turbinata]|uniref:AT-hook motif nuclear-localized protein n=1 Tax=Dillenia turbinata TaxID=194707 RepID=A0AAN8Z9L6_9MAGN